MSKIVIFGNASIAKIICLDIMKYTDHEVAAFVVDKDFIQETFIYDKPVYPYDELEERFPKDTYKMFIAAGYVRMNKVREARYQECKQKGYQFINMICPSAITYEDLQMGENCYIGHNSVIYNSLTIGNNVYIGSNCAFGHDTHIDDNCFFSDCVAVSGFVNIGVNCFFGTNSTVRNKVSVGKECVIGAGAIILEDAPDQSVYIGSPAKALPIKSDKLPVS